ncbi:MAG: hypothetical protein GX171_10715 [Clostridiales bacterium]|nr:hypothetical protein [Clostridiales bacterium]
MRLCCRRTKTTVPVGLDGLFSVHTYLCFTAYGCDTIAMNTLNWVASQEGNAITSAARKAGKVDKILELINYMYSEEGTILIS